MDVAILVGLVMSGIAAVAAGVVISPTRRASRPAKVAENVAQFKRCYEELGQRQTELDEETLRSSPPSWRQGDIPMLTRPGWLLERPLPLDSIILISQKSQQPVHTLVARSRILTGLDLAGPITYSKAVTHIAGMQHFSNGVIYRLMAIDVSNRHLTMKFDEARYFDYLDTSEVLSYEKVSTPRKCSYRELLGDPFKLTNRVASLGVLTLTLKHGKTGTKFLLHKRTADVVLGAGLFHVIPAGEFTPSDVSLEAIQEDLSIWRNIVREYAEELLGREDAQGHGGRRIDYDNSSPYKELAQAASSGALKISVLGLGLDPLTWKPELLTVAVFDGEAFDLAFGERITGNFEGTVIEDIPYTEENVHHYTSSANTRLGAKACLLLSWRHRAALGLG